MNRATRDLAVAKIVHPSNVPYGHRRITWSRLPPTPTPVYLIGTKIVGGRTRTSTIFIMCKMWVDYICSGLSYWGDVFVARRSPSYTESRAVIWRSREPTVEGYSGWLFVRPGESTEQGMYSYHVVGFQSHEISCRKTLQKEAIYWKIALEPPMDLTGCLWASAPRQVCQELEQQVRKYGVCLGIF